MQEKELSPQEIDALFSVEKNAKKETGVETETRSPDDITQSPEKEDKAEVQRSVVLEALSAYREAIDAGDDSETAKSKGVQKINEILSGEYDDLAIPITEQFLADLKKESTAPPPEELPIENIGQAKEETPKAKSIDEIREDVQRLNEMVQETETEAKSKVQFALDNLVILIDEAEQAGFDVIKYRNILANVFPRDHMRDVEGYLSGSNKPILMNADNFEEYKARYEKIVESALEFIETTKNDLQAETEQKRTSQENLGEPKVERTPEENREKLAQAVSMAIETFNNERLLGSSIEKAKGQAVLELERLSSTITNTPEENQAAVLELQQKLEEFEMAEKAEETENTSGDILSKEEVDRLLGIEPSTESSPASEPAPKETPTTSEVESTPTTREDEERLAEEMAKGFETPAEPTLEDAEKVAREIAEALGLEPREVNAVAASETRADVEKLPEETREKLGLGFNNLGFFVEENKNRFFSSLFEKAGSKFEKTGTMGRFVSSLAENYRRDQERAKQKFEEVKNGDKHRLSNAGYLFGNIVRYGRTALDFTGYTIASPVRYVMMGAMMFGRGSEAAKEARLKNEEVIEKTRVTDINKAEEQAWKIYEEAQQKAGDGDVSKEDLNRAFTENLPADILNRLNSEDLTVKTGMAKRIVDGISRRWVESSLDRLQNKLNKADTEEKRQIILAKFEAKLNDFNRMIGEYGSLDTMAISARLAEKVSKGIITAVSVETLVALPLEKLFDIKIWDSLSDALGMKAEIGGNIDPREIEAFEINLNINSADGLNADEARKVGEFIGEVSSSGDKDTALEYLQAYGHIKVEGSTKSVQDYFQEWANNQRTASAAEAEQLRSMAEETRNTSAEVYAKGTLHIDISDGISPEEAQKIAENIRAKDAAGDNEFAKSLRTVYGNMRDSDGRKIIDIVNSSETPKGNVTENIPTGGAKPESVPHRESFENLGPAGRKEFSNLILGEKDSVWQSTEDTFRLYKSQLGYDPAKDGDISAWVRIKTAEVMHELAEKQYSGKGVPDVVHDNDKIAVYIGEDGKPHLRFEETSGIKSGYLEKEQTPPEITEEPNKMPIEDNSSQESYQPPETGAKSTPENIDEIKSTTPITQPNQPENIMPEPEHPTFGPKPPEPEMPQATETNPVTWKDFQKTYESLSNKPEDIIERHHVVRQYLMDNQFGQIRNSIGLTPEKINVFAHMFNGDWEGINPEHMRTTLESFDSEIKQWTQKLVSGELNESLSGQSSAISPFPIEAKNGQIFYAEWQKGGKWKLYNMDESDRVSQVSDRGFLGRAKDKFSFEEIQKMLGYKSPDEIIGGHGGNQTLPIESSPRPGAYQSPESGAKSQTENIPETKPAQPPAPTSTPASPTPEQNPPAPPTETPDTQNPVPASPDTNNQTPESPSTPDQSLPKQDADTIAGEKIASRIENMNEQVSDMRKALQTELQEHPIDWNTDTREHIGIKDPDSGNTFLIETRTGNTMDSLRKFRSELIRPPVSQRIQVEPLKEEIVRLADGRWKKIMYYGELK